MKVTYAQIQSSDEIRTYIAQADASLTARGFTEHSFPHVTKCAETAAGLLKDLGYDERQQELARIAGFMHDIGNLVNRYDHAISGATMAFRILDHMGMDPAEVAAVSTAIGHHDAKTAFPVNAITAALILADKTDVRRSRVRPKPLADFDIHDRVNYAVTDTHLDIDVEKKEIRLDLQVDESICTMFDYFDIFLSRMQMSRRACDVLGATFSLTVNGGKVL